MSTLLEVDEAVVEYRVPGRPTVRAVDGVSLGVARSEVVGLVGESGCGKSSLGRAIVGLNPLSSGAIRLDGRELRALGRRARSREDRGVQMIFQDPYSSLNPRRTVARQLADAIRAGGRRPTRDIVVGLLESVGLPASAASRFPHQFSGGQRQRIAIARALGVEPKVIVADEPVSALDASTRAQVAALISETATAQGAGVLMISHDLSGLRVIADRIAVMYFGRIVEVGPTEAVWGAPAHPYTRTLIGAIPQLGRDAPLPSAAPPRPIVSRAADPEGAELVDIGGGHLVAAEALREVEAA
ncbi:ABC transporter ATP-binding protein [Homoserinibacter sp. GY 40078]|uniref:ABC transporter ATP-binding protein n=1 Tax=Homoserinibacter sp. GY 40078 TaxID=2603275 RepID=UPI0011C88641|nr:ATP-binding cassette domain-containing protein [Homoserinibacter sp. GY 40078]TXK19843.1 ABC transporter ATP-binding protein [Homoserinibacter sp. GY 40078]